MKYRSIPTISALSDLAQGRPIDVRQITMAVGDGAGQEVEPFETQTHLVHEVYRTPINRCWQDPDVPQKYTLEMLIPQSLKGKTLREAGAFDGSGSLKFVASIPPVDVLNVDDGVTGDITLLIDVMYGAGGLTNLQIDPNVQILTRAQADSAYVPISALAGGLAGQALRKRSNASGDYGWEPDGASSVVVTTLEEAHILDAAQTVIELVGITTNGLAIYIGDTRLQRTAGASGWLPDLVNPDTRVVLGKTYAAGTRALCVQNEPAGEVRMPLSREANLSDLADKAAARQALGVPSIDDLRDACAPGRMAMWPSTTPPKRALVRDGSLLNIAPYADLFSVLGNRWGGDGISTFALPDDRGLFERGWSAGGSIDAGREFGSVQHQSIQSHSHDGVIRASDTGPHYIGLNRKDGQNSEYATGSNLSQSTGLFGSDETRPINRAYLPIIYY